MLAAGVLAPDGEASADAAATNGLALFELSGWKAERLKGRALGASASASASARLGREFASGCVQDCGCWTVLWWHSEASAAASSACQAGEPLAGWSCVIEGVWPAGGVGGIDVCGCADCPAASLRYAGQTEVMLSTKRLAPA